MEKKGLKTRGNLAGHTRLSALSSAKKASVALKIAAVAALAISLTRCGGGGSMAAVDPPAQNAQNASAQTLQLSVSPSSVAFGNVQVGGSASQTLAIENTGSGSVSISSVGAAGTGFSVSGPSLPLTLAAGQSANFTAVFAPKSSGAATGSVSVASNAAGSPAAVALSGSGTTTQANVTPASVNFGNVMVGAQSTAVLTMSNTGGATVTVTQVSASGSGFSVTGPALPLALTSGRAASFAVAFAPVTATSSTGSVSISSDASNGPVTIPLAGAGETMSVSVSPAAINFGSVNVGASSTQSVAVTNTGTASVIVSQASASGAGFAVSASSLPVTLAGGQSAALPVIFAPTTGGSATGSVSIVSSAGTSAVALAGSGGTFQLVASPSSVNFGSIKVGGNSSQPVSLTNTGNSPVVVSQATASTGFTLSGLALPITLAAGQSASFSVAFSAGAAGNTAGSISIASNAVGSPLSIPLSATGVVYQLTVSPSSYNFGSVNVGSSASDTIWVNNSGSAPVTISQAALSGAGFSFTGISFPVTLSTGQSVSFSAMYQPAAAGAASGSITLTSNASNSPTAIALSGTGATQGLSITPTSLSFGNVVLGNNSALPMTVTNTGTGQVTISQATASGSGFSVTSGPTLPLTLNAGQNAVFDVTFNPPAAGGTTGSFTVASTAGSPSSSLSATGVNHHSVTLNWTASTSSGVSGYNVYSSSTSGGPYTKLNSALVTGATYTDNTVLAGDTYYYVTTAVDSSGTESSYSNQATAAVPSP